MVRSSIPVRGARLFAAVLALGALTACDTVRSAGPLVQDGAGAALQAAAPLIAADMVSVVATDKTIIDHVTSIGTGQDCSTLRAEKGGHYCKEPYENEPVVGTLYCYRTLADVTCYAQPSPHPTDKLIGYQEAGRLPTH